MAENTFGLYYLIPYLCTLLIFKLNNMDIVNNIIRIEARKLQISILTNTGELPSMLYCECEIRATLQYQN